VHPYSDSYLCLDPDYTGNRRASRQAPDHRRVHQCPGKYGEAFFGSLDAIGAHRLSMDWSQTKSATRTHITINAWVARPAVRGQVMANQLDDFATPDGLYHRYWMSSRVEISGQWPWLVASMRQWPVWYGVDPQLGTPGPQPPQAFPLSPGLTTTWVTSKQHRGGRAAHLASPIT